MAMRAPNDPRDQQVAIVCVPRTSGSTWQSAVGAPAFGGSAPACDPDRMLKLSEDEYKATYAPHPVQLGPDEEPPFDFWPYFEAIPSADFGGHDFSAGVVPYVWRMPETVYEHVLVQCETPNVFLVLVLDMGSHSVVGHHLLDLNQIYGPA